MLYAESEMIYQSWRAFGGGDEVRAETVAELLPGATGVSSAYGGIEGCILCRLLFDTHVKSVQHLGCWSYRAAPKQ